MRARACTLLLYVVLPLWLAWPGAVRAADDFTLFESGQVRPLALSADGSRLFAVNTPDDRLEIFDVGAGGLTHSGSVFVGLEPVAVAVRSPTEVWVVNLLSDSISIVDVGAAPPRVRRTLLVGDEPRDIVFAGPDFRLAFVTTAHRGQNSPIDPQPFTPGVGRADVWVFDSDDLGADLNGAPKTIVTLFGDTPRALAASPDGHTVYAAIFLSGNRTTTVPEEAVCDGGAMAPPCEVNFNGMPGGLPLPNANADGVPGPETGLIVKYNLDTQMWEDEWGRNWNNAARFRLPDKDVFAIDAYADPPQQTASFAGVGTVLYGMAVNPATGAVYVSNTEARNEVRLEPRLRGHQHESHLTIIDGNQVVPRDLNKHLDCSPLRRRSATSCDDPLPRTALEPKANSLALPNALAVSGDGASVYLAAYGSSKIGVFSAAALRDDSFIPNAADQIEVSGGGPSGIVLDEARGKLYVFTRFDNGVSTVDLAMRREVAHDLVFNPEPQYIRSGRRFLYDANLTSANGESTCASCHVFGDVDGLGWDLGDPDGPVLINLLPLLNAQDRLDTKDFHPLKGPMTTQTLQGLLGHGPMHWRGDRNATLIGGDGMDERLAFDLFNPAFVTLMGRDGPLTHAQMETFTDFVLDITPPPNPFRPLDNSLTPAQQTGRDAFFQARCFECHELDPANKRFGTSRKSAINAIAPQFMKVPALRGAYKKIGRFFGILFQPLADPGFIGDQVRGFGFQHDGSAGRTNDPADAFLIAFDANLAPAVGQQITLTSTSDEVELSRAAMLAQRADAGECDLVAHAAVGGEERGWLRRSDGGYDSDRSAEAPLTEAQLRELALQGLTLICVPSGSGRRTALDRDRDGVLDGDERLAGTDPADPGSFPGAPTPTPTAFEVEPTAIEIFPTATPTSAPATPTETQTSATPTETTAAPTPSETAVAPTPPGDTPAATATPTENPSPGCSGDCDGDGEVSEADLRQGIALLFGGTAGCNVDRFDRNGDQRIAVAEILAAASSGCE